MGLDIIAEGILSERGRAQREIVGVRNAINLRRRAQIAGVRLKLGDTKCPLCGDGLKRKVMNEGTFLLCVKCGTHKHFPGVMDAPRNFNEPMTPGVTGQARGTPLVVIDANGKIKMIHMNGGSK